MKYMLVPNAKQTIQLIATARDVEFFRDGQRIFYLEDRQPYTSGWFGLRTVTSHVRVGKFRVYRLLPAVTIDSSTTAKPVR
jgi:hypothetical protein